MIKLLYITFLILLFSCIHDKKESGLNGFDISPNMKDIVFSYKEDDSLYSIYTKPINNGQPDKIISGFGNYVNPKFIDSANIVALYYPTAKSLVPEFHFYNIASRKLTSKIKIGHGFISDYVVSSKNKIYYLQAQEFESYSPIAPESYHNFDIYELDLVSSESQKISNMKAYAMNEILDMGSDSLLVSIQGSEVESGLFFFAKAIKKENVVPNRVIILNDTLRNSTMYRNQILLPNNNILCASSYQMVILDLKSKMEYSVLASNGIHYTLIRNVGDVIFYQLHDKTDDIYYFNTNDMHMNTINIKPKK